jgi:predicted phosphodiesterase
MRYAIISDIHANWQAWSAVRDDIYHQGGVDCILCLGDVVGYGPQPARVFHDVVEYCGNFVLGNHDAVVCGKLDPSLFNDNARYIIDWTCDQLGDDVANHFAHTPMTMGDADLYCAHAEAGDPEAWGYIFEAEHSRSSFELTDARLIFVGHTHQPLVARWSGVRPEEMSLKPQNLLSNYRYLVNVGSVGDPRDGDPTACYALFDTDERHLQFRRLPFDYDAFKQDLKASRLPVQPFFLDCLLDESTKTQPIKLADMALPDPSRAKKSTKTRSVPTMQIKHNKGKRVKKAGTRKPRAGMARGTTTVEVDPQVAAAIAEKEKQKKLKIIIGTVVGAVLLIGGAIAMTMMSTPPKNHNAGAGGAAEPEEPGIVEVGTAPITTPPPTIGETGDRPQRGELTDAQRERINQKMLENAPKQPPAVVDTPTPPQKRDFPGLIGVVSATASNSHHSPAEKSIDWSGMSGKPGDEKAVQSNDHFDMWTPAKVGNYIQWDFGEVQPVRRMLVWQYNQAKYEGRAILSAKLEYSVDGKKWTGFSKSAPEFWPPTYGKANDRTVVDIRNLNFDARFIKLTCVASHSGEVTGVSEVLFYGPNHKPTTEPPAPTDVDLTVKVTTGAEQPLQITEAKSTSGQTMILEPGGIVTALGELPDTDTYKLALAPPPGTYKALRLHVLKGPNGQVSRAVNIALTRFTASLASGGKTTPIKFVEATADFSQANFGISGALDDDVKTAWALHPQTNRDHWAEFRAANTITIKQGDTLSVALEQNFTHPKLVIGRLRLELIRGNTATVAATEADTAQLELVEYGGDPNSLLVYEGFEYSTDKLETGKNSGKGWSGPWKHAQHARNSALQQGSLSGEGASEGVKTSGNHFQIGVNSRFGRTIDTGDGSAFAKIGLLDGKKMIGPDGKTVYLSLLVKADDPNQAHYLIELNRGGLQDRNRVAAFGAEHSGRGHTMRVANKNDFRVGNASVGSTSFFVMRIDYKNGNDSVKMYLNPPYDKEPAKPNVHAPNNGDMSFNGISLAMFSQGRKMQVDEIRIGTTYASVMGGAVPTGKLAEIAKLIADKKFREAADAAAGDGAFADLENTFKQKMQLLKTFHAQTGKTLSVGFKSGTRTVTIKKVTPKGVLASPRPFTVDELSGAERIKRLGEDNPAAWLYVGMRELEAGGSKTAAKYFDRSKSPVGKAVAYYLEQGAANRLEKNAEKALRMVVSQIRVDSKPTSIDEAIDAAMAKPSYSGTEERNFPRLAGEFIDLYGKTAMGHKYAERLQQLVVLVKNERQPGIYGEYYDNADLKGEPKFTRVKKNIDFNYGGGGPGEGLGGDNFSARWSGYVMPKVSGTYFIEGIADDGISIRFNNNDYPDEGRTSKVTIHELSLKADRLYPIEVEYHEGGGGARAQLVWWEKEDKIKRGAIPAANLFCHPKGGNTSTASGLKGSDRAGGFKGRTLGGDQ